MRFLLRARLNKWNNHNAQDFCDDFVFKLKMIFKTAGSSTPLAFPSLVGNRERWEDSFFIFLKIERRAWIITEITNPLSTRLRFVVEIRGFHEPSLLKLQALQENGAQSFDIFPKLHFEKPHFFHVSRFLTYVSLNVCWSVLSENIRY